MPEFLDLLSIYYYCDAMAAMRPLPAAERFGCTDTYEAVRAYFLPVFELAAPGTPERAGQLRTGFLAFHAWQDANPSLVDDLRSAAEARALAEIIATQQ